MATHRLEAAPETVHWGFFDAKLPPQLTIDSGDTVTITTVSGTLGYLPKPGSGLTAFTCTDLALMDVVVKARQQASISVNLFSSSLRHAQRAERPLQRRQWRMFGALGR